MFVYPAWHSVLLAFNNCSPYIFIRPIQSEMNQAQEVPFFCPHFQCKLSEQSHWRRHWHCEHLNLTGWEFRARPLCISLCNNNTKTINAPLKATPVETGNWASIYPSSDSLTLILDPIDILHIWIISTAKRGISIDKKKTTKTKTSFSGSRHPDLLLELKHWK